MATQRFLFSPLFGEDFHPLTSIFFRWGWFNHQLENYWIVEVTTIQGTNISPKNVILKMIFLFPRWDMLIPCRVQCTAFFGLKNDAPQNSEQKIFTKNRFLSRFPSSTFFFLTYGGKKRLKHIFRSLRLTGWMVAIVFVFSFSKNLCIYGWFFKDDVWIVRIFISCIASGSILNFEVYYLVECYRIIWGYLCKVQQWRFM